MKRIVTYLGIICLVIYYQRKSAAHPSLLERGNHDNERNKHSWISNRTIQGPDSRNKRKADPGPRTDPQLILPNDNPGIPLLNSDAALSLIPRREFAPTRGILRQREFIPGGLLPTPRIIKPLDLGPSPLDLERRPFIGQGIVPIAPEFHRHLPLLEEPRHLLPSFARPRHLLTPFAGPRHILPPLAEQSHLLTPLAEQGTLLSPLVEQRHLLPPLAEQRHLLPPLEEPRHLFEEQRHYFPNEGASRLYHSLDEPKRLFSSEIGELRRHPEFLPQAVEPSHRDLIRPDGLQRHSFYHKHHNYPSVGSLGDITLPFGSIGDEKPDSDLYKHENDHPDVDAFNGSPGQENELSELKDLLSALGGRKKTKKTWVTDVNVYDKKRKLDDLASLFGADDDTDDGFDPCSSKPCHNGGVCRSRPTGHYECVCTRHYKGKHCTVRNRCYPNPCAHGGKCTETTSGFECSCTLGYQGTRCTDKNRCLPNPCLNGGSCNESPSGYVCSCSPGFQGKSCDVKRTTCDPNPCMNNGHCLIDGLNNIFQCVCQDGYGGSICERSLLSGLNFGGNSIGLPTANSLFLDSELLSNHYHTVNPIGKSDIALPASQSASTLACLNNPCMNNGICIPDSSQIKGFRCQCVSGYQGGLCEDKSCNCQNNGFCTGEGPLKRCICRSGYAGNICEKHTRCNDDTCMHGGLCIEEVQGFKCICQDGYKGVRCEGLNKCNPNPCLHGGSCKDLGDFYKCECPENYKGKQCEDYNFCFPNPCQNGGTCFNYERGFQCDCPQRFSGKNCEKIRYCSSNPCKNGGQCSETDGSFKCTCIQGYNGKFCEGRDFCWTQPCQNGGTCLSGEDTFLCTCPNRFIGGTCEIPNRCADVPCKNGGKCNMQPTGEYTCDCQVGFTGLTCEQPDECQPNPCKNGGECANNPGGFTCRCKEGFRGVTCADPDPCHPNPCSHGQCTEINGGFVCNCSLGFRGPICEDIDRCAPNPCQHGGTCREIVGGVGYVCDCPVGYKGQICDLKDLCNPNPCLHEGICQEAQSTSGFTCQCGKGWRGSHCQDVDPCFPNPCDHSGLCIYTNDNSGFRCNCTLGFKGSRCSDIDLCSPNPCRFGTHCIQTDKESYECVKNLCTPNPCQHDGKCIVVNDETYECACSKGWRGKSCKAMNGRMTPNSAVSHEVEQDVCYPNPCLHDGVCAAETKGGKGFTCTCPDAYKGKVCEETKEKPKVDFCVSNPCLYGATCINTDSSFSCRCALGFSGPICEESVCLPNPCMNGGTCVPYYGIALCKCNKENTGAHCSEWKHKPTVSPVRQVVPVKQLGVGTNSLVAKESTVAAHVVAPVVETKQPVVTSKHTQIAGYNVLPQDSFPQQLPVVSQVVKPAEVQKTKKQEPCDLLACYHDGQCVERTDGLPECICSQQFSGPQCEEIGEYGYSSAPKFFPKDECRHCDENALCVNSHCICKQGFVGDGLECWRETKEDKEWLCNPNPCQNAGTCKQGRGKCVCRLGYTGQFCQNYCPPVVHLSFDKVKESMVIDESGNGNTASLANGAEIVYEGGKCDSGASILGGDILFDGERFWPKPVEAVTIAVWIKLDTNKGIQSIFDTVGDKFSTHHEGQYHLEIENGKVRWFHRNEKHDVVFSVTSQPLVNEGMWTHAVGTYDSFKRVAKIFVNGDLVAKASGIGYLSQDWTKKAGIGKHEHPYGNRLLRGMVDEFYIFTCALPRLEILVLMHHCKLYFANKKHQPYVPDKSDIQKSSATSTAVTPAGNMNIRPHLQLNYNSIQNYIGYEETKSKPSQPMVKINSPPNDKWSYKISDELHETGAAKGFIQKPSYQPKYQQIISRYRPVKPAASIRNEKFDYASPELMLSKFSHPQVSAFTSANNVPLRNSGTQQFQQSIASYKQTLPLSRPSEYQPQDIYSALRSSVSQQPDDLFSNNPPAAKLSSVQEQSNDMQYYLQQRPKVHDSLGQNWMTYVEQRLAELTSRNDILPKMTHHVQKPVFSNSQSQPSLISKNVVNNLVKINQQNIKTALPNKQNTFLDFFDNSKQYLGNHANINLKHFMPNNQNTIKTPTGNNMILRDQFVHQKPNVQAFSSARFNEMNNDRFQTHGGINMNHGSMAVGKPITRNMNPYSNQNQILSEIVNNKYQTMQSQRNAYKAQTAIQEEPKDTFSDFPYVTANAKHNFVSVPLSSSPELSLQVEYQTPQPPETANAISRSRLPQSTPMKPRQIQGNVLYSLAQYTSIPNAVIAKKVKTAPNNNKNIRKPYANQNLPNYRNSLTARVKGTPIQQEYQQNYIKAAPPQRAMLFSRKLPQIARPYQPNQQQQNGYFQRNSLRPMVLSRSPSAIRVPKVSTDKTQFRYRSPVASQSKSPAVSFSKVLEAYYLNSFPQRQPQLTNKALMNSRSNGYYMHNFRNSQSARLRGVATPAKKVNLGALNNAEKQVSVWQNPWVQYQRAKAGLQSRAQFSPKLAILQLNQRDHQYQAADSHAQTSTNSDTTAGATAPGQKGAGYNFGYGYGYGSGNENQGGGWGKGWGGGGPGVNSAGAHQPPNYQNNPSFKYGFGQGMGQGGKGVTQQNQGNPGPSRSKVYNQNLASSFISPRKPSLGTVVPRGPSIMNFGSTNKWKSSMLDLSSLRPSSPAYQIKYFTTNMANGAQTSSDRILKNEIISNAIADALKGLQKKKRRKRKNDKEIT